MENARRGRKGTGNNAQQVANRCIGKAAATPLPRTKPAQRPDSPRGDEVAATDVRRLWKTCVMVTTIVVTRIQHSSLCRNHTSSRRFHAETADRRNLQDKTG